MKTKALFLDRDGVINKDSGYVYKIKDFHLIDGIFELLLSAMLKDYLIIIITNQAGIGRGYYNKEDFLFLSDWMSDEFARRKIIINKIYYSPYHPVHGIGKYKRDDRSRKPNPGMIEDAREEFDIDLTESLLIGDKVTDIQAGLNAGISRNIFFSPKDEHSKECLGYYYVNSLHAIKSLL